MNKLLRDTFSFRKVMIMHANHLKDVVEKGQRLAKLQNMFKNLQHIDEKYVAIALGGHGGPLRQHENEDVVRADRLLRVLAEEINDLVGELTVLGVEGLPQKVVE